jgi:hypothetical protein
MSPAIDETEYLVYTLDSDLEMEKKKNECCVYTII